MRECSANEKTPVRQNPAKLEIMDRAVSPYITNHSGSKDFLLPTAIGLWLDAAVCAQAGYRLIAALALGDALIPSQKILLCLRTPDCEFIHRCPSQPM